jgi:hypothetical protein
MEKRTHQKSVFEEYLFNEKYQTLTDERINVRFNSAILQSIKSLQLPKT